MILCQLLYSHDTKLQSDAAAAVINNIGEGITALITSYGTCRR